ncbi:hypothetical protein FRC02_002163, partial [Tulasnella sp. 418]
MAWHYRIPANNLVGDTFHITFKKEYEDSWYALPMQRAAYEIIQSMQIRWTSQ